MQIRSIRVLNYKCFNDSGEISIPSAFTIVTGKNNAGKTALTQAISLTIEDKPHRSPDTAPSPSTPTKGPSTVHLKIALSVSEFYELVSLHGQDFNLPKRPNSPDETQLREIASVFARGTVPLLLDYRSTGFAVAYLDTPCASVQSENAFQFSIPREGTVPTFKNTSVGVRMSGTAPLMIAPYLRSRIYIFKAERFNVGQHTIGADPTLLSDASNLAQALNNLQTRNPSKYEELISHVHTIFPDVHYITAPPHESGGGLARITVWTVPVSTQRADLAIPLQESGTGLGQVLAILYVAISSDYPRTIVIDEPQSFLHPGAVRKLVGILQAYYSHHQYIVTTHSPTVLTSAVSPAIIHLTKSGSQSTAQLIDPADASTLRALLSDVGARLSDVFGPDNILWVEGRTEEACLPIIITKIMRRALIGTAVVGVLSVGDLHGKGASKTISIYNRLSKGSALLPPAVGFIFDKERKSEAEQQDITRLSHGSVRFLPRRMYENYLINPTALAAVMAALPGLPDSPVTEDAILEWMRVNGADSQYLPKSVKAPEVFSDDWLRVVDGARLLHAIFLELSAGTFGYDKVEYGIALTTFLCEHEPQALSEIAQLIESILDAQR